MKQITLGSLFDGIGAFPYAASLFGVKTLWASEILPAAVSVTKRHFPDMLHVGDITKLSGELLPPVDIIAFGSPCQDLSQAAGGNRKGLDGERSGLFMEAIRIINEMRCATNGKYPRYGIWENVPGCFSSNARRDYKAVLEAFTDAEIPMPESGRWANAGMVRSDRVNLSWCVYDAQHFGLAQRRKRVFLIADFAKGNPEKILLIPKSLRRYPPQSFGEGQSVTAAVESGVGGADGFDGYNFSLTGDISSTLGVNCGMSTGRNGVISFNGGASPQAGSIAASETVSPTLKSASSGLRTPCVCEPVILNDQGGNSLNIEKDGCSPTLRCNTHGNLPIVCTQTGELPAVTMRMRQGCEGGGKGALLQVEKSGTLATGNDQTLFCIASTQADACINMNLCPTITAAAGNSGNNKPYIVHPEIAGTLCGSAAGLSRPAGMASETDLAVAYCLQGNMIGREDKNGPAGGGVNMEISYTLNGTDHHAVAHTFGNNSIGGWNDKPATLKASGGDNGGGSENLALIPPPPYIVRRLTPVECERLMGLPSGYTGYGADNEEISDSKRYQMLGNSIAVPCAAYIIQGILEQYEVKTI